MKTGRTLSSLAAELERINETKRDFVMPTTKLTMNNEAKIEFQTKNGVEAFEMNSHSSGQIAAHAEIPKPYFDRLASENKNLLADNVNHGFARASAQRGPSGKQDARMVRTLDGKVRGFLSSSYRILDSHDLMEVVLPHLIQNKFEVRSTEITDKRLYLKATTKIIQAEIVPGDVVQYGVMVSTSDVGAGSLRVEPFTERLVCTNGMVSSTVFKKAHLGRNQVDAAIQEILTDETKRLNDAAFFATLRDYLLDTMKPEVFAREVNKMKTAAGIKIENFDLEQVVELAANAVGIRGEAPKKSILAALASGNEGAGLTMWGLANSFTRAAGEDAFDYDTATELERAGGLILDLNPRQWKAIAGKAA